jgi:hypothetical protein
MKKFLFTSLMIPLLLIISGFTQSPFLAIVSPISADYAMYQVKVTYTGAQLKSRPSLLLCGHARIPNANELVPYQNPSISYGNDDSGMNEIVINGSSIKKFVDALALRSELQVLGGTSEPEVSLMIQRGSPPSEVVFEHLATTVEAQIIMNLLEGAISTEPPATKLGVRRFRNYTIGHH